MILLDGRHVRISHENALRERMQGFWSSPTLAIIQVGSNPESTAYIEQKKKCADRIGARVIHETVPPSTTQHEIIEIIQKFNHDTNVHGIILQLPVPGALNRNTLIEAISPSKDVDGLTSVNIKKTWRGGGEAKTHKGFLPATAKGVLSLLQFYKINVEEKHVVVLGRSDLVGKPIALSMLAQNATVTVCHSKTKNLKEYTKQADILIVAIGKPHFIDSSFLRESGDQVVVDVGINLASGVKLDDEIVNTKLVGDVNFHKVKNQVAALSPVPGGVGPMTVVSLFENLVEAYELQHEKDKK